MKKLFVLFLIIPVMVSCAGSFKQIETIPSMSAMDETKTCDQLKLDIVQEYGVCIDHADKIRSKHAGNAVLGVTGAIIFWPALFALDLSKVDNINYANHVERYNWLVSVAQKNECNIDPYEAIDINAKPIQRTKNGEEPIFTDPPPVQQSVVPQTGNASDSNVVVIDGKIYRMVPDKPVEFDDSNCPWLKSDRRRNTCPHICAPAIDN